MRKTIAAGGIALAAFGATLATACGSSTPVPHTAPATSSPSPTASPSPAASRTLPISAAAACNYFQEWYLKSQPDLDDHNGSLAYLLLATAAAPSGQLYQDMSTLQSNALMYHSSTGALRTAEHGVIVTDAYAVEQDCQSVNPGSSS